MNDVFQQVMITCTTLNVVMMIANISLIICDVSSDHRAEKKRKREEKEALEKKAE